MFNGGIGDRLNWVRLRQSMWFVPGLMVLAGIVLAELMVLADRGIATNELMPGTFVLGAEGSRGILVAIGGSVLAIAATMFSITMSVIATASSTYGPRLVRNFMSDLANQRVLGLFVATFVYCLLVLRRIEEPSDDSEGFLPHLAIYLSILLALASVGALIFFLHHIAEVIQVSTLILQVRCELEKVAEALYGDEAQKSRVDALPLVEGHMYLYGRRSPIDVTFLSHSGTVKVVTARKAGFVTTVQTRALIEAARTCEGRVDLIATPGTHVLVGDPLAYVLGPGETLATAVRRHVQIGHVRTPEQDVHLALQQLVEMAVRAVSPSTNDPYTACNAVDELAVGLVPALRNPEPLPGWTDVDGKLRLRWAPPEGPALIDNVFDDLRTYAAGDPLVVMAAFALADRLLRVASPTTRARLDEQLDDLVAATERAGLPEFDLKRLRAERESLRSITAEDPADQR